MSTSRKRRILSIISTRLVIVVSVACLISMAGIFVILSMKAKKDALDLITSNAAEICREVYAKTDEYLEGNMELDLSRVRSAEPTDLKQVTSMWETGDEYEKRFKQEMELSVIRNDGTIMVSSVDGVTGKNVLTEGTENFQAAADVLRKMLAEEESFGEENICSYYHSMEHHLSFDGKRYLRYYGWELEDGSGLFLAGISDEYYEKGGLNSQIPTVMNYRQIGRDGYTVLIGEDGIIRGGTCLGKEGLPDMYEAFPYPEILSQVDQSSEYALIDFDGFDTQVDDDARIRLYYTTGQRELFGEQVYYAASKVGDWYLLFVYPQKEANRSMYVTLLTAFIMEILVFLLVFVSVTALVKGKVINGVYRISGTLASITQGNLDEKADVHDSIEFDALSGDINTTVDRLKGLIAEAKSRIDKDLGIAREIQISALPSVFPPFPEHKEFELFASMRAVREVGGDFYDYSLLDDHTLGFLIADVSGKSIPGAMFMMASKNVIKGLVESGLPPSEVFTEANKRLCQDNEAAMFLTAWMGYFDLKTGEVRVANAGHNPPLLIRDGKAEYVVLEPGLMLAGLDDMVYGEQTLQLQKGDILFLYTDGVTEAMDEKENLYGEDRLRELLSFGEAMPAPSGDNGVAGAVCELVAADIERFVQGAEQSDDITMLCVRFLGEG